MEDNNQKNTTNTTDTPVIAPVEPPAAAPAPVVADVTSSEVVDTIIVPATPTPTTETTVATAGNSSAIKQYVIAGLIIVVMGSGLLYALEEQGRIDTQLFSGISEMITPTPLAAIVNDVTIPLANFEKNKKQLEQAATAQGADVASESVQAEIKKQALDVLVNTELLKQAAVTAGIMVTAEQVDARYAEIITSLGSEEQLQIKMAELGITTESLRKDIEGEIMVQTHLAKAVDVSKITIDPAEAKAVYDQANTPEAKLPPFEQVKSEIESQLSLGKEQELVNAYIETLRTAAKIEIKI